LLLLAESQRNRGVVFAYHFQLVSDVTVSKI